LFVEDLLPTDIIPSFHLRSSTMLN